jgi:vacuolar iron transporter family protein
MLVHDHGAGEHGHGREEIRHRLNSGPRVSYLRDWVYGGIDGAVTTFAIVAGVVGADLSNGVILILGAANLFADGFSMAAANYSATRTEIDEYAHIREMEERHIEHFPDGEREEVRQLFAAKGFRGDDLERVVEVITADRKRWIETMMAEEHGLPRVRRRAWKAAVATFLAFLVCGSVPLAPFVLGIPVSFWASTVLTGITFFAIGSIRSNWSPSPFWLTGLETTTIGLIAAGVAYAVGHLLASLAH